MAVAVVKHGFTRELFFREAINRKPGNSDCNRSKYNRKICSTVEKGDMGGFCKMAWTAAPPPPPGLNFLLHFNGPLCQ